MPKRKTRRRTHKKKITNYRTNKKKRTHRKRTKRGGGFFDTIKKSIGLGKKESPSEVSLDESEVRKQLEKKINLNTKLYYIKKQIPDIIEKYWAKFLNKKLDRGVIDKLQIHMDGIGYYDEEKVEQIIGTFGGITEIEKEDIRTCIKLYIFVDNLFELNDIATQFITLPNESGTLQTDIWVVLKDIVKDVSSEINFKDKYKTNRESLINKIIAQHNDSISIYRSSHSEIPDPYITQPPSPSPAPSRRFNSAPRSPSPAPSRRFNSAPRSPSPAPSRRFNSAPRSPSPAPRSNNKKNTIGSNRTSNNRKTTPSPLSKLYSPPPHLWELPTSKL